MIIRLSKHLPSLLCLILLWAVLMHNKVLAQEWQSSFYRDHALVGKIWDTDKKNWITEKQLQLELREYDYILLGETHNNPDHHLLQARLLNSLVSASAKPTVVMEMLASETWQDQPRIWSDLQALQEQAISHNNGWPWELYTPILQSVVEQHLELVAGNIESKALHAWANKAASYTPEEMRAEYLITTTGLQQLSHDIVESHCGHANVAIIQFMARVQLQRDRTMTSILVKNKPPVVLIAGSGHVRNDYAIPMQLLNKYHRLSYLSIAFMPVLPALQNPQNYLGKLPKVFDILYFTPNHTDEDPCVRFRKQLQNLRKSNIK